MNNRHALRLFLLYIRIYMRLLTHIRNGLSHYACAVHCRVCAKRLLKAKSKCTSPIYLFKPYAAKLLNTVGIDTNNDDKKFHPEHFCPFCKCALDKAISVMHRKIHCKCGTAPFQWERHSDQECKVVDDYTCANIK